MPNIDSTGKTTGKPARSSFVANASRVARWRGAEVWLRGYWAWDWYDEALRIAAIDEQHAVVFLDGSTTYGIRENRRYVVINAPEELDSPGEYFIDRKLRTLYFWPPAPIASMQIELTRVSEPLIRFDDSAFLELDGIVIESTRGTAIHIEGGRSIEVKNCVVRNIGGHGIEIRNGTGHKVGESKLDHLGLSAISVSGGDRARLVGAHHVIQGNSISDVGTRISAGHPAIDVNGVGALVQKNDIRAVPQIAIRFMGNDHRIEGNSITSSCSEGSDCGVIYTGRDWTTRGNVVAQNTISDSRGVGGRGDVTAIYLDDLAAATSVTQNRVTNIRRGVLIGGGRDNKITGNTFRNVDIPVSIDARGTHDGMKMLAPDGVLQKRLNAAPYKSAPWRSRYPELLTLLGDEPALPKRNVVQDNALIDSGAMNISEPAYRFGTITDNRREPAPP